MNKSHNVRIPSRRWRPPGWLTRIFLVWLIALSPSAWSQSSENSLLWEITGTASTKPSYLFGTYHLLNSDFLNEIPRVKKVFERADGVVVEAELDSSQLFNLMFLMIMPEKKLDDILSTEELAIVSEEVKKSLGGSIEMFAQFKPAFITTMLTATYSQKQNEATLKKYGGRPLDIFFAQTARSDRKKLATFETMEEQIHILFDHDPVEEQAKQLLEFIKSKDEMIAAQEDLLNLYLTQNLDGLYKSFRNYSRKFGDAAYLLEDRNKKWMNTLPGILSQGNQFIAVGAMHLTGPDGLIKLLRKAGYQVRPLKTSP